MSKKMLVSLIVVLAAVVFCGCSGGTITIGEVTSSMAEDLKANTETVKATGSEVIKVTVKVYVTDPIKVQVRDVTNDVEDLAEAAKSDFVGQVCKGIGEETCTWIGEQVK